MSAASPSARVWFRGIISSGGLMLLLLWLTGCNGPAPAAAKPGVPAAANQNNQAGGEQVADDAGDNPPNGGQGGDDVALAPPGANDDDESAPPPAKNPLIQGLSTLLETNPALEDVDKSGIREQLLAADEALANIKAENREALRQLGRQQRLRGAASPNIVWIVASGLGQGDLPLYQTLPIHTPELDALAADGAVLTNFYAGSPNPLESRWCLVTGKRLDRVLARRDQQAVLLPEEVTIAETMWQAGYTTALFGHWGQQSRSGTCVPSEHGFDIWAGTLGTPAEVELYPTNVRNNQATLKLLGNTSGHRESSLDAFCMEEAIDFCRRAGSARPVFVQLFLSLPGPTAPDLPSLDPYAEEKWPAAAKQRAAAITQFDYQLGRLRERMTELKMWQNTLVIVTSDTPPEQTVAQLLSDSASKQSATEGQITLRGSQGALYDGGLRVPLIIRWPGRIPAGTRSETLSAAWDLCHTAFDAVSAVRRPRRTQGQSLLLHLKADAKPATRFLYFEVRGKQLAQAVRWNNWKAVRPAGTSQFELYDVSTDPAEAHNVAADHPEVIAQILERLQPLTAVAPAGK